MTSSVNVDQRTLEGKVAIVTGAGGGLGRASALKLAARGARLVLVDIAGDDVRATADMIEGEAVAIEADVSSESDVVGYLNAAKAAFGRVDLHHLNAGIVGALTPLPDVTMAEFDALIGVNLRGQFLGLREAVRAFMENGHGGSVVVTTSIHGLRGSADLPVYQIAKHGLVGLVRAGAVYGGPLDIRVNGVAPGIVPTARDPQVREDMRRRALTGPLRRAGTPEEIANAVAFLLGDESSYITGAILPVDGGASAVNVVRPSGGAGAWDADGLDAAMFGEGMPQSRG